MAYLTPGTWNGNALSSSSWRALFAPRNIEGTVEANAIWSESLGNYPALTGINLGSRSFALWMISKDTDLDIRREEITSWFNPDAGSAILTAYDSSGACRQMICTPTQVQPHPEHPRGFIVMLNSDEPVWESACPRSASAVAGSGGNATFAITPSGNEFAQPTFTLNVNGYRPGTNHNRYWKKFSITNVLPWALTGYPVEVWGTYEIIIASAMRDDGRDVRVEWRGQPIDCYAYNPISVCPRVWINVDLEAGETAYGAVYFGDLTAPAASPDPTREPIFTGSISENSIWYFDRFGTELNSRPASWRRFYDGPGAGNATADWAWVSQTSASLGTWSLTDPWKQMGLREWSTVGQKAQLSNGYMLSLQAGASAVWANYGRRLNGSGSMARLQGLWRSASQQGAPFSVFWDDTVNTSSGWAEVVGDAWDFSPSAREIAFRITTPECAASLRTPDNYGAYISRAIVHLENYPVVSTSEVQEMVQVTASLSNSTPTPTQSLVFDVRVALGTQLTLNTKTHAFTNDTTGCFINHAFQLNALRRDWLPLLPGIANNVVLAEANASDLNIQIQWRDRWL